jgi:hypothetical protein
MLPRDDLAAALAARRELGPDYDAAFLDKMVDRLDTSIEARLTSQLDERLRHDVAEAHKERSSRVTIAVISLVVAVPASGIAMSGDHGTSGLFVVWLAITLINVAYALTSHRR